MRNFPDFMVLYIRLKCSKASQLKHVTFPLFGSSIQEIRFSLRIFHLLRANSLGLGSIIIVCLQIVWFCVCLHLLCLITFVHAYSAWKWGWGTRGSTTYTKQMNLRPQILSCHNAIYKERRAMKSSVDFKKPKKDSKNVHLQWTHYGRKIPRKNQIL